MDYERQYILLERIANALEKFAETNFATSPKFNNLETRKSLDPTFRFQPLGINGKATSGNDINPIFRFLYERNIQIKTYQFEDGMDETLDNIALIMGHKFRYIKKIYTIIKSNLNTGSAFSLDLSKASQEEISINCQLCNSLHKIAFLSDFKYLKSPQYIIHASPNRIPAAINFFTGQWLERFIKTEVKNSILKHNRPLDFAYLTNPQIILPNGDDFELDVLFAIEEEIFWFEAKTRDYQNYIDKYSRIAKLLQLDSRHAYIVLTDLNEESCNVLKKVSGMEVVNVENFSRYFLKNLNHT